MASGARHAPNSKTYSFRFLILRRRVYRAKWRRLQQSSFGRQALVSGRRRIEPDRAGQPPGTVRRAGPGPAPNPAAVPDRARFFRENLSGVTPLLYLYCILLRLPQTRNRVRLAQVSFVLQVRLRRTRARPLRFPFPFLAPHPVICTPATFSSTGTKPVTRPSQRPSP
jgi:hypothetical protein